MSPEHQSESNLKGRMAEQLVYDLLRQSGNEVYRIGMEFSLPENERVRTALSKSALVGDRIRSTPDFLVIDKLGTAHLVEVKFRWNPEGHETDYKRIERVRTAWPETLIVFVNCSERPYVRVSKYPFLDENNDVVSESIEKFKQFRVTKKILQETEALVEKYLKPTLKTQ